MIGKEVYDLEGRPYKIIRKIAEGAQGVVYESDDNLMIKINYTQNVTREELVKRYKWIIRQKITPKARIVLPIAILDKPYAGYVMKKVRGHVPLEKYILPSQTVSLPEWYNYVTGGLKKRLEIGALLGKSLRNLHISGVSYCDLSPSNVLVAENKASTVLIDPDNLTSTTLFNNSILGTPRYIAPELFDGNRQPNSLSDIYAYAVILFEMLRLGHPMLGEAVLNGTPEEEEEALKGNAVYIEHPDDKSNCNPALDMTRCLVTEELSQLFEKVFVEGISRPIKRPNLNEFRWACVRARDQLVQCSNIECKATFYYEEKENKCPWCGTVHNKVRKLSFLRSTNVREYRVLDLEKIALHKWEDKQLKIPSYKSYELILNEGVQGIYRHHFDTTIELEQDAIILALKLEKNGDIYVQKISSSSEKDAKDFTVFIYNRELKMRKSIENNIAEKIEPGRDALIFGEDIDTSAIEEQFGDIRLLSYAAVY